MIDLEHSERLVRDVATRRKVLVSYELPMYLDALCQLVIALIDDLRAAPMEDQDPSDLLTRVE